MTDNNYPKRWAGLRIAGLVTGVVAGLAAVALLALGVLSLWADGEKDDAGYLSTHSERFGAGTRALASENMDINLDGAESFVDSTDLGDVRLEVAPRNGKPVFLGIARTADVSAYLRNVAHTAVTDIDSDPFRADYQRLGGERKPAAPADAGIWAASSHGSGVQSLNWEVQDGDWSVVVMNDDGSPGVYADISAGAKLPFLDELGWTAIGSGTAVFLAAIGLIVLSVRPPRGGRPAQAGTAAAPAAA